MGDCQSPSCCLPKMKTNADEDTLEERIAKLERLKAEAVAKEDYELAASLKKQIERLKGGGQPVKPVEPEPEEEEDEDFPLHDACREEDLSKVRALLKQNPAAASTCDSTEEGWGPLHIAAMQASPALCELLLSAGATALYIAAEVGNKQCCQILLDKKGSIELADADGWSPLVVAAGQGHLEMVKLLLANRADPNSTGRDGSNPLVQASANGHTAIVRLLIEEAGADVAKRSSSKVLYPTALHAAAREGHVDVAQLLLPVIPQHILEVMDYQDYTPLRAARANGHGKVVALIQERMQQPTLPTKL